MARKLFGKEDPMGKVISMNPYTEASNFTVTGVLEDLPNNSQFKFEYILPWLYMKKLGWDDEWWGNNSVLTFVKAQT